MISTLYIQLRMIIMADNRLTELSIRRDTEHPIEPAVTKELLLQCDGVFVLLLRNLERGLLEKSLNFAPC